MSKGAIITLIVVIVLVAGGLIYWYATMGPSYSSTSAPYATSTSNGTPSPSPSVGATTSVNLGY